MQQSSLPPLQLITDLAPALIAYVHPDQRVGWCNGRCHEWCGRPPGELIGRHLRNVLGDELYAELQVGLECALGGQHTVSEHYLGHTATGDRWARVEFVPHVDAAGVVAGIVALARDITGYRRRADAVQASEAMLQAFLDNSPNVSYVKDRDGRYILVSQSYVELFNTTKEALLGKTDYERFSKEVADYYAGHDRLVLESRRPMEFEEIAQIEAEARTYISVKFPLLDSAGEPWCICGISTDITKLKAHERSLVEADRRKDEFLAMLAHELRNPLAPIRNVVDALRLQPDVSPERLRWALDTLDRQTTHLSHLVGDLLDVARITTGRITLRHEPVDLNQVVAIALDNIRGRAMAQGMQTDVHLPDGEVMVSGDRARLVQVVDNLLDNALKYTDDGGHIEVAVNSAGGHALLRVRDTGMGIDPQVLPRIFELFGQGDSSLARSQGGLGLGLALVRRLVMLMGGSVEAHSEGPGRGSEFEVRLERADAHCAVEEPAVAPTAVQPRRVLVVDDKDDVAAATANLLSVLGHQPRTAPDAEHALTLVETFRPEIALIDIGLPGIDGYELARRLRASHPELRLIAVSGYADARARKASERAGFEQHLGKPLALKDLLRALAD